MIRRLLPVLFSLLVLALSAPPSARAASNDEEVEILVLSVLEAEYAGGQHKEALEKLNLAKQACATKSACSPKIRAQLYVALGTVYAGGLKKPKEAKDAFATALREDPTITLFPKYTSPDIEKSFNEARGGGGSAPSSGGDTEPQEKAPAPAQQAEPGELKKTYKGGRAPRGWRSGEAAFYYTEAVRSEKAQEWVDCISYGQASLAAENRASTRFLMASCEERAGLWVEAMGDYQTVADSAPRLGMRGLGVQAGRRADELRKKIPKLVIRKSSKAEELKVRLNGVEIDNDKLGGEIWVNPGERTVIATGKVNGVDSEFEQTVNVGEFESVTVDLKLEPKGKGGKNVDRSVFKCMVEAKTQAEFDKCAAKGKQSLGLNLRFGSEVSGYHDSDRVDVVTPAFFASVESPTGGWGFGGSILVDVVTAASSDIVSTASPRWTEVRYVPALGGHKKFGDVDVNLHAGFSIEPDYFASSVGTTIAVDLKQKTITPSLTYDFGYDVQGRAGTSYDTFSRRITRHGIDLASTFVLDKSSILATSFTTIIENGDSSKPYRAIPMFSKDIAPRVLPGQSIASVNFYRNPERVLEQLPLSRLRFAVAGRYAHRFTSSTLRVDERLYVDNWGLKASTTDMRLPFDVGKSLRLWPHLRFHGQTGVSFWKLAYVAEQTPTGLQVPALRSGDRELGPLLALTGGAGARVSFGETKNWGLTFTGDVIYTRFLETLFILQRFGYFGALTLEVDVE
ncbi:DUF3570 domain-containing protein [Polyangium aurulentum]|uniref:DUF3570 domain-containing protein n=1 Tax=Polyangium aurulentum TaxID=2567896 RepID=UPI0010AE4475|nr:DUF3570 domain-containing protein [Polyangium aurulentum]UQA62727.1 DUF3570 domain-containing protein [Polyangium aurulentum]